MGEKQPLLFEDGSALRGRHSPFRCHGCVRALMTAVATGAIIAIALSGLFRLIHPWSVVSSSLFVQTQDFLHLLFPHKTTKIRSIIALTLSCYRRAAKDTMQARFTFHFLRHCLVRLQLQFTGFAQLGPVLSMVLSAE